MLTVAAAGTEEREEPSVEWVDLSVLKLESMPETTRRNLRIRLHFQWQSCYYYCNFPEFFSFCFPPVAVETMTPQYQHTAVLFAETK